MGKQVPLESSVVATIIKKLNAVPGCRVKKFHGSAFGMMELDIYGCFNGRAVFIEVKRPGAAETGDRKVARRGRAYRLCHDSPRSVEHYQPKEL